MDFDMPEGCREWKYKFRHKGGPWWNSALITAPGVDGAVLVDEFDGISENWEYALGWED